MFDEEKENITEPEEMTPEEESFSQGGNSATFRDIMNNREQEMDGKKLRDTIDKGREKNRESQQQQNQQQANNKDSNKESKSSDDDDKDSKKEEKEEARKKLQDPEYAAAVDAIKLAASKAGVPEPLVNKILESKTGQAALDEIKDLIDEIIKRKKAIKKRIIAVALPYAITILSIVFVAALIMTEFYQIVDRVDKTLVKIDEYSQKVLNLATGNGWNTEEEQFFKTLKNEYEESRRFTGGKGINVPLVAATIHYNYMVDLDIYSNDENPDKKGISLHDDTSLGSEESLFDDFVDATQTKNFYQTANDKLGKVGPAFVGNKRLLGHLASTNITWEKKRFSEAFKDWVTFFGYYGKEAGEVSAKAVLSIIFFPQKIEETLTTMYNYDNDVPGAAGWLEYRFENFKYELSELVSNLTVSDNANAILTQEQIDSYASDDELIKAMDDTDGKFPAPVITYEYVEEVYRNYLRNVYIPLTYGVGKANNYGNDPSADTTIDMMIDEIFNQADAFNDIFHYDGETTGQCHYEYRIDNANGDNATINVNGVPLTKELMDNLKVRVDGNTISLEDYIMGVTYAESSGAGSEARKANMIAQQSFLFSRASVSVENGVYYFTIENSSNAQNYCNVHDGCVKNDSYKRPLTDEEIASYKETYNSIKYQVLYDSNEKNVIAYYRAKYTQCPGYSIGKCMGQRDSYQDAENGSDYKSILAKYYTQLSLVDVVNGGIANRAYVCYSRGLIAGAHGAFPIRSSASTPSDQPYNLMSNSNFGECVWYAKGRALEIISTVSSIDETRRSYIFDQIKALRTGNGNQYCDRLLELKSEDGTPLFGTSEDYNEVKPGALACYDNYVSMYNGYYGHVVVVEDVNGNNVTVSQMGKGFGSNNGYFNTRTYTIDQMNKIPGSTSDLKSTRFIRYIYLLD